MSSFTFTTFLVFLLLGISLGNSQDVQPLDLINSLKYFATKLQEYVGNKTNLSPLCSYSLIQYASGLSTFKPWALNMFDAGAKIPSGILVGHFVDLGTFDQCMDIETTLNGSIYVAGRYCLGTLKFNIAQLTFKQTTEELGNSMNGSSSPKGGSSIGIPSFQLATCMPHTCSPAEIQEIFSGALITITISEQSCQTKEDQPQLDRGAIATISFLAIILGIMTVSTIYDTVLHYTERKTAHSLLIAFSVLTNGRKLFETSKAPGQISSMHGMRVISIMWIVLMHKYTTGARFPVHNLMGFLDFLRKEGSMYVVTSNLGVDTFFLMSGWLLSYSFMNGAKKGVKFNIIKHYLHRYLRLTPVLAVIVLIYLTLLKYLGSGPIYANTVQRHLINQCEENWWKTLLYVQNYVESAVVCVPQSWYLAVDMQLYLLSPIILVPLVKRPRITLVFVVILTIASMVASFVTAWVYELKAHGSNFNVPSSQDIVNHQALYYTATHTRAGPWLIGILFGYLTYKINQKELRLALNKWLVLLLWAASLTILCSCVFAGHDLLVGEYDRLANSFFDALVRPSWALGCGWVVLACTLGYGGPVNWFLSMPFFEVLSKLTYSLYLCHPTILYLSLATVRVAPWVSSGELLYTYWGDFVFALAFAAVLALAFEFPMVAIDNFLLGGKRKKATS